MTKVVILLHQKKQLLVKKGALNQRPITIKKKKEQTF